MVLEISRRSCSGTSKDRKIDVPSAKAERDNSLVGGLQRLVDRMSKPTFSGDPLVRLKQFIEAAEKDTKSSEKDRSKQRSNVKNESSSGGSVSRGANAGKESCRFGGVGRLEAGGKSWKIQR